MGYMSGFTPEQKAYVNRKYYDPSKRSSFKSSSFKLPALGGLLNIAVVGGVVYIGYKLYLSLSGGLGSLGSLFGGSTLSAAAATSNGDAALANTFISTSQAQANVLSGTASSLSTLGYSVSSLHQGLANTFHDWLDSIWVDHAQIVNTILNESVPTFQLVSVAYGTREILTYVYSHPLNDLFLLNSKQTGTLKDHLKLVLSNSEQVQISQYLSSI